MKFNQFSKFTLTVLTGFNFIFLLFINVFSYTVTDGSIKTVSLFKILFQREDTIALFPQEFNGYVIALTVIAVLVIIAAIFCLQFSALQFLKVESNSLGLIVSVMSFVLSIAAFVILLILNSNVDVVTLSNVYFLPFILAAAFTLAYIPLFIFGPKDPEIEK